MIYPSERKALGRTSKRSESARHGSLTRADIRAARQVPLKPVLESLGYQLQSLRNGNYLLCRLAVEIVIKDHYWVCKDPQTAAQVGKSAGNAIDFLVQVQGMRFKEAVEMLLCSPAQPAAS